MKKTTPLLRILPLLGILCLLATACSDKETAIGTSITGDGTLYQGQQYTLVADRALSVRDDSLMTTGYSNYNSYGIIGYYQDAAFGRVDAMLYTQIALPSNANDINFSGMTIDSVVLTLVKQQLYPDTTGRYRFHFEVMQLAEPLLSDTLYCSKDSLQVDPAGLYYDADDSVRVEDTVIRLLLDNSIGDVLKQTASADEFVQRTKGLRVRLTDAGDMGMFSVNFAATRTCLTVYYRYRTTDTVSSRYTFLLGTGTPRFTRFVHDYSSSVTLGADSLDGSQKLYLEPLAGYSVQLSFDNSIRAFAAAHPSATVHYAELLLPLAPGADNVKPDGILAKPADGSQLYIDDLLDIYALSGFDGKYDETTHSYRLRVTQHVQGLLRAGHDNGLLLMLNGRQYNAARTFLCGPEAATPLKINIVYSE